MTEFVIGRYGVGEWRLVRYDGSEETVGSFDSMPSLEGCIDSLMDYHGTGNTPFSSRAGAIDAHILSNAWPVSTRDMTLADETLPWNDPE